MFQGSPPRIQFCIFWWCSRKSDPKISKFSAPEVNRKFQIFLVEMLVDFCLVSVYHVRFSLLCLEFKISKSWRWNAKQNDKGMLWRKDDCEGLGLPKGLGAHGVRIFMGRPLHCHTCVPFSLIRLNRTVYHSLTVQFDYII